MNRTLKKIRVWLNKNDGAYFQIENQDFNLLQVIGFLLVIASFIVYLLHDKTDFSNTWLGWLFLCGGLVSSYIGIIHKPKK